MVLTNLVLIGTYIIYIFRQGYVPRPDGEESIVLFCMAIMTIYTLVNFKRLLYSFKNTKWIKEDNLISLWLKVMYERIGEKRNQYKKDLKEELKQKS